ncbi:growth/differentiation factor 8-like isoform X2 [Lytechinus pictus]|uniref:growth/differentiation factor 8-like isoform X2 n=1 Tax=Lytechinus pictus TaxID=7653 RepID=UPI0030B9C80F
MYTVSGSHPFQLSIFCFVLLCNCIHLSASPARLSASWPKLRIFGVNGVHESPRRRIPPSTEVITSPPISSSGSNNLHITKTSSSHSNHQPLSFDPLTSSSFSTSSQPPQQLDTSFPCPNCRMRNTIKPDVGDQGSLSTKMSAAEKEYRIQALKKHILDALHLQFPPLVKGDTPNVDPKVIEKIFSESEKYEIEDDEDYEHDVEKTNKQLIVGVAGEIGGYGNEHKVKLSFVIPADVQRANSVRGKLWLGITNSSSATTGSLFVIQRLYRKYFGTNVVGVHRMESTPSPGSWISIDLSSSRWSARESSVVMEVIPDPAQPTVDLAAGAVLEVSVVTREDAHRRRTRRGIECQSNNPTACCLQPFSVSRDDLNWNWLIAPANIRLNYCRGSCDSGTSPIFNHSSIFYAHTMRESNSSIRMRLMPCCTPKRLGEVQMLINSGDDSTFYRKTIPNLIVRECGCA